MPFSFFSPELPRFSHRVRITVLGHLRLHLFKKQEVGHDHGTWLDYKNAVYYGGFFSYLSYGERELFPLYADVVPADLSVRSRYRRFLRGFAPFIYGSLESDRARQRFESHLSSRFPMARASRIMGPEFYGGYLFKRITELMDDPSMVQNLNFHISPKMDVRRYDSAADIFRSLATRPLPELLQLVLDLNRFIFWALSSFKRDHPNAKAAAAMQVVVDALYAHIERWLEHYLDDPRELSHVLLTLNTRLFRGWFGLWLKGSMRFIQNVASLARRRLRGFSRWDNPKFLRFKGEGSPHWYHGEISLVFASRHHTRMSFEFPRNSTYEVFLNRHGSYDIKFTEHFFTKYLDVFLRAFEQGVVVLDDHPDEPDPVTEKRFLDILNNKILKKGKIRRTKPKSWLRDYVDPAKKLYRGSDGVLYPYTVYRPYRPNRKVDPD